MGVGGSNQKINLFSVCWKYTKSEGKIVSTVSRDRKWKLKVVPYPAAVSTTSVLRASQYLGVAKYSFGYYLYFFLMCINSFQIVLSMSAAFHYMKEIAFFASFQLFSGVFPHPCLCLAQ